MLTGKQAFTGETTTEILAAVVTKEPDLAQVPAKVRRLLRRCLEKDPKKRLRDIGDAWELVEEAPPNPQPQAGGLRRWLWPAAAAVSLLALALLSFVHFRETPPALQPVRLQIPLPEGMAFNSATFAISPDGRKAAVAAGIGNGPRQFWIRDLDSLEFKPLPGTEVPNVYPPPFWSPDSRY